ncbi:hypothetical protein C2G38_2168778 [Gigaspora rosea]|uniref:Uncharacterized protein n=1 Tax=Gigaspora rosea TaxID=44941 RepID=A0A397VP85_9GLOM|nr:hypothetical protein C2G38_2168778 [Gigaspora rosea]CAG8692885.1 4976_t:CDS:1 [Gigaspora rosea]
MVKISKIIAFLILIYHVHLTTTLPTHVLEERNLTMLLANISGHDLKKRDSNKLIFDPLNLKGTIIRRPADLPRQIALIGLAASCEKLKTFLAFCLCCWFNNYDTVIDGHHEVQLSRWDRFKIWFYRNILFRTDLHDYPSIEAAVSPIQGPSLREMWREYQESEYYDVGTGSSSNSQLSIPDCPTSEAIPDHNSRVLTPCLPQTVDDIVRPLDPSTSETCRHDPPGPPTSQASTSQCRIPYSEGPRQSRELLLELNGPGFAEFLELISYVPVTSTGIRGKEPIFRIPINDPRIQMNLWNDYTIVQQRFAKLSDMKLYLEAILRHARVLKLNLYELRSGLANYRDSEELEELIMYCEWDIKRKQREHDKELK